MNRQRASAIEDHNKEWREQDGTRKVEDMKGSFERPGVSENVLAEGSSTGLVAGPGGPN